MVYEDLIMMTRYRNLNEIEEHDLAAVAELDVLEQRLAE